MRIFAALEVPEEIKDLMSVAQRELKRSDADVAWVEPHNMHLTLKFFGETDDVSAKGIGRVLDSVSSGIQPFECSLEGMGAFPNILNPRVIWSGVRLNRDKIEKMAASIDSGANEIGFDKEERPYSAHVTLGRVRSSRNMPELSRFLKKPLVPEVFFNVDRIHLFKSTLSSRGPVYSVMHTSVLGGKI